MLQDIVTVHSVLLTGAFCLLEVHLRYNNAHHRWLSYYSL
jgi:hypothetical protein